MDRKLYHRINPGCRLPLYVAERGGDPSLINEYLGQNLPLAEQRIGYFPGQNICCAYEHAADILDDPYLGLKFGLIERDDFANTGPMVFLLNNAIDIRQAVDMGIRYHALHTNGIHYAYEEDIENKVLTGVFTFHPTSGAHRQLLEHVMTLIAVMGRTFIPDFEIKQVTFQHRAPENLTWYKKAFQAPAFFNAPRNTMLFDLKFLNMKRGSLINSAIQHSLELYMRRKLKHHPYANKTVKDMVWEVLPALVGVNKTDKATVANSLGMHPKKLQRLLRDEGTSYKDILDDVRKLQAIRLLTDSDMNIENIAKVLDYSSARPFNHACKRWFGMGSRDYRESNSQSNNILMD